MADLTLEKVDILRKRFPISYRAACEALERNDNNVVKALIEMEEQHQKPTLIDQVEERAMVMGSELLDKIQEIVRTGQASRLRVMKNGRTIWTLPTAVGAVGALLFPYLTVIATVAAMAQRYELVWDKRPQRSPAATEDGKTGHTPAIVNVHHEEVEATVR